MNNKEKYDQVRRALGYVRIDEEYLKEIAREICDNNPANVQDFLKGNMNGMAYLMREMREITRGRARYEVVWSIVYEELMKRLPGYQQ